MELKVLLTIFVTIFLSELGDKSQMAAVLFSAEGAASKWVIFLTVSAALVVATGISVLLGSLLANYVEGKLFSYIAGAGFILIGGWTIYSA